jgi:hypothetical protein
MPESPADSTGNQLDGGCQSVKTSKDKCVDNSVISLELRVPKIHNIHKQAAFSQPCRHCCGSRHYP